MSESDLQFDFSFEAICFSTNYENCNSIQILKQYFMSTKCSDILYNKNNVTFKHILDAGNNNIHIECNNNYIEISPSSKNIIIKDETDCFIIFFDLEYNDSISELYKIFKMVSDLGIGDKKFYLICIYTDVKNKNEDKYENEIKEYLGNFLINNYDLSKVNMETDELSKKIDKITIECLQEKSLLNSDFKDFDNDKSKSMCIIS